MIRPWTASHRRISPSAFAQASTAAVGRQADRRRRQGRTLKRPPLRCPSRRRGWRSGPSRRRRLPSCRPRTGPASTPSRSGVGGLPELLPRGRVPAAARCRPAPAVVACRPSARKATAVTAPAWPAGRVDFLARGQVPHPDRAVPRRRRQPLAVRRERNARHAAPAAVQDQPRPPALPVPQPNRPVAAGRRQRRPVGRKDHRPDGIGVALQLADRLARGDFPQPDDDRPSRPTPAPCRSGEKASESIPDGCAWNWRISLLGREVPQPNVAQVVGGGQVPCRRPTAPGRGPRCRIRNDRRSLPDLHVPDAERAVAAAADKRFAVRGEERSCRRRRVVASSRGPPSPMSGPTGGSCRRGRRRRGACRPG